MGIPGLAASVAWFHPNRQPTFGTNLSAGTVTVGHAHHADSAACIP